MERFNPPAFLDDFALRPDHQDALARGWDAIVGSWYDTFAGIEGGSFYDPRDDTSPGRPDRQSVPWDAFPRVLEKWFDGADDPEQMRWRAADTLAPRLFGGRPLRRIEDGSLREPVTVYARQQDEYCEWHVKRTADRHIDRITFSCEAPEYWRFLAGGTPAFFPAGDDRHDIFDGDLGLVLELYRSLIDPAVAEDDLVWPHDVAAYDEGSRKWYVYGRAGTYNPFNRWTTTDGVMHLTQAANTLRGEFVVASRASVLRKDASGRPVDDAEALVCCSGFGEPNRSSDPSIGSAVNGLAAQGLSIALADPIAVYMAGINVDAFQGPDGEDASGAWRVERGDPVRQMILRATFAAPEGAAFTVDEMRAGGTPIAYGGQVADEVQMILTGLAKRRGSESTARRLCVTKCCEHPEKPGVVAVVGVGADCTGVDWQSRTPVVEGGEVGPEAFAAAEADVEDVLLAGSDPTWDRPALSR